MNILNRFIAFRAQAPRADMEQGISSTSLAVPPPDTAVSRISRDTGRVRVDPTNDAVTNFRLLVGITSNHQIHPPGSTWFSSTKRPAPNVGIFTRIIHSERRAKESYKTFSWVINSCFGLQIIVAAALTAMGAGDVNHKAITVFGAINTVIAGLLTFLKGSGLPNRLKYYRNEWKKLREYIEQRERELIINAADVTMDHVHEIVETIEQMYEDIKTDIEASTPDAFVSGNNARMRIQQAQVPKVVPPDTLKLPNGIPRGVDAGNLSEKMRGVNEQLQGVGNKMQDVNEKVGGMNEKAHHGFGARLGELKNLAVHYNDERNKLKSELGHLRDSASKTGNEAERYASEVAQKAKEIAEEMVKREKDAARKLEDQASDRAHDAAERAQGVANGAQRDMHDAAGVVQHRVRDATRQASDLADDTQRRAGDLEEEGQQGVRDAADGVVERGQAVAEGAHQGVRDAAEREHQQVRDAEESAHQSVRDALR